MKHLLVEHAKRDGAPLMVSDQATFVWDGRTAPALVGDFNLWDVSDALPLERIAPGTWTRTVRIAPDAYFEYAFVRNGKRFADPLNKNIVNDGMGHHNSFAWMPDAIDTPLTRPQRGVPRGEVTRHSLPSRGYAVDATRVVHLYRPATSKATPLLVVFDGSGYLHKAHLAIVVDNLIAQRRIHPISMALVDPAGHGRVVEYACSDATVAFIMNCVLPLARERLRLIDTSRSPGRFGMMGASMGGLMSLYTALRAPEVFGRVLCESGAFGADFLYYKSVINDLIGFGPAPPIKIWMDCGEMEWFITPNRHTHALLRERGYDVTYVEHTSGHNYPSWRNVLWRGLEHLYG